MTVASYVVVGGAGFIGSHLVGALLERETVSRVTVYDNFTSGRAWHLENYAADPRFGLIEGDGRNSERLVDAMLGHHTLIHLASNPDIAKAATEPAIDFDNGTLITH